MRIAVFGLGYVGSVTAVCLALAGHEVWGIDTDQAKVEWMSNGIVPVNEIGLATKLKVALGEERLHVVSEAPEAVANTEMALICVGTPLGESASVYLGFVENVVKEIDRLLCTQPHPYTVVVRSTIVPGTMAELVVPTLQKGAGVVLGEDLRILFNPEFLREGSAIQDFYDPPFTVVGLPDVKSDSTRLVSGLGEVYAMVSAPFITMSYVEAELLKIVCNAFHALKIDFANEVGTLAARLGADPNQLMNAFVRDTKLNISPAYLRPGFAFGGSCLPKDIRSLVQLADERGLDLPLCDAILPSNRRHLDRALSRVMSYPGKIVGIVGLVFKHGTDDVRKSPSLWLARRVIDAGRGVVIYEPQLETDRLLGANLRFLQEHLPEYRQCLVNWESLSGQADVIVCTRPNVIGSSDKSKLGKPIVDLYRIESD